MRCLAVDIGMFDACNDDHDAVAALTEIQQMYTETMHEMNKGASRT